MELLAIGFLGYVWLKTIAFFNNLFGIGKRPYTYKYRTSRNEWKI